MFQELINLLKTGKTYSQYELAQELDISIDTLHAWIKYLATQGLLSQVNLQKIMDCHTSACSNCMSCQGCSGKCKPENELILWELNQ